MWIYNVSAMESIWFHQAVEEGPVLAAMSSEVEAVDPPFPVRISPEKQKVIYFPLPVQSLPFIF